MDICITSFKENSQIKLVGLNQLISSIQFIIKKIQIQFGQFFLFKTGLDIKYSLLEFDQINFRMIYFKTQP